MSTTFHDIYLIVQRYLVIIDQKSFLTNIKLKYYIPFIFLTPILILSPFLLAIEIIPKEKTDLYTWRTSDFGKSLLFQTYFLIISIPEIFLSTIILIIMNIITIKAYKSI